MSDQITESLNGINLRSLLEQRVTGKIRRRHRQWFCLDPRIQAELDVAEAKLAELVGNEIRKQQLHQQTSKKYNLPTNVQHAQDTYNRLKEQSRQVGVMGVFQNLNDEELTEVLVHKDAFDKAKAILTAAFLHWEDADGKPIPDDQFGRDDLATLMQPEVLEQGEWLPLATKIITESRSVIDRPTSPA